MFVYRTDVLSELELSLSRERFAKYLGAMGSDREKAARLYTWNTAISAAFYGPLQSLEVGLRNAMHRQLSAAYGPNWFDIPAAGLDERTVAHVQRARDDLQRKKHAANAPDIVAALSFGFWISLLERGGRIQAVGGGKADYEKTLWRPALRGAFPHAQNLTRRQAQIRLNALRHLRNRIAHHEPIFPRNLQDDLADISQVLGWISPHKQAWMQAHCRIGGLLTQPPDDPHIRF